MSKTPREFINLAWEVLPEYGVPSPFTTSQAIELGVGTCINRSSIIGREAVRLGMPAMRMIMFGADRIPNSYRNVIKFGDCWMYIHTGHIPQAGGTSTPMFDFEADQVYVLPQGRPELFDYESPLTFADGLVIPEAKISLIRGCMTYSDHIDALMVANRTEA